MVNIYDEDINASIENIGINLKNLIKSPEWAKFVKTGSGKERPPVREDWYHIRAASVLVTVYKRGPIGVNKLKIKYGSNKNRGHKPGKFVRASGKILRSILQQLEKAELVKYKKEGMHKGRIISAKGKSLVDKSAVIKK